jgi:hypothetical protein
MFIFDNSQQPTEIEVSSETMDRIYESNLAVVRSHPGYRGPVAKTPDVIVTPDAAGPTKRELRRRLYASLANAR